MSQSVVDLLDEQSVVASLQPGPRGKVRLSYEYPRPPATNGPLSGWHASHLSSHVAYSSSVIELDRAKLRKMQFSQEELAEIGFSLVARLCGLARAPAPEDDA
jgi:hypothetical protein